MGKQYLGLIAATKQIGEHQLDPKTLLNTSFELANQLEPNLKATDGEVGVRIVSTLW